MAEKKRERGRRFPSVRYEHSLELDGSSHSVDKVRVEEREHRGWLKISGTPLSAICKKESRLRETYKQGIYIYFTSVEKWI